MYYEYFLLANQIILQDRQKKIDEEGGHYRKFAIDYYGINLINCFYGPYKLYSTWKNDKPKKAYESLTQYSQEELFANIGPVRYITRITP